MHGAHDAKRGPPLRVFDLSTDLAEGILDPFPLLLAEQKVPAKRKPSKSANPLLLVTETKGTAYSLHYGAMPLDAFHTEGLVYGHNNLRNICPCLGQAAGKHPAAAS